MLCPHCYGTHFLIENGRRVPCPECNGIGSLHCCDGMQCQTATEISTGPAPVSRREAVERREVRSA